VKGACELVRKVGATVVECACAIELEGETETASLHPETRTKTVNPERMVAAA
jgi:adenine/guanine phosphoribosyltransferase-like PRPP-binding protein